MDVDILLKAMALGAIQGVTEFLPISSTAHLLLAEQWMGYRDPGEVFTVVIQFGSILAVLWCFWERLAQVARRAASGSGPDRRFLATIVVACLPACILGAALNSILEKHVFPEDIRPGIIAGTMMLGGMLILLVERTVRTPRHHDAAALPWATAIGVGFLQVLAMVPGVSRSGASIIGGMAIGIDRRAATEFSFFMAIPIMLGASTLKLVAHHRDITLDRLAEIGVGFAVAFVSSLLVVRWLLRYVSSHSFAPFAWYRILIGGVLAMAVLAGVFARPPGSAPSSSVPPVSATMSPLP